MGNGITWGRFPWMEEKLFISRFSHLIYVVYGWLLVNETLESEATEGNSKREKGDNRNGEQRHKIKCINL